MTQPSPPGTTIQLGLHELALEQALRLPRHAAETVEVVRIMTSAPPPFLASTAEANDFLGRLANTVFTEAQLVSELESALNEGFTGITVTYRRKGGTCTAAHLWTLHGRAEG